MKQVFNIRDLKVIIKALEAAGDDLDTKKALEKAKCTERVLALEIGLKTAENKLHDVTVR